jgi:hypothetical protein
MKSDQFEMTLFNITHQKNTDRDTPLVQADDQTSDLLGARFSLVHGRQTTDKTDTSTTDDSTGDERAPVRKQLKLKWD